MYAFLAYVAFSLAAFCLAAVCKSNRYWSRVFTIYGIVLSLFAFNSLISLQLH